MVTSTYTVDNRDNDRDHYSSKPHMFDGEKFDYWKGRIEIYFLAYDLDLWHLVVDDYTHSIDEKGHKIARSEMTSTKESLQESLQRNNYYA